MKQIIPILALSLALTAPMVSSGEDYSFSAYSDFVSVPLNVTGFSCNSTSISTVGPFTSLSGSGTKLTSQSIAYGGGYTLLLPPNTDDGYYLVSGLYPYNNNGTAPPSGYALSRNSTYNISNIGYGSTSQTFHGLVFVPAHTYNLYLHVFSVFSASNQAIWGFYYSSPKVDFYPSSGSGTDYSSLFNEVIAGITSLESALSRIENATTQLSPMGQFESDYLDNYQDQLQGVEGALSGDSSSPLGGLAPNGGDYVGFAEDLTDGFGFSSSFFSPSQFSEAVNSLSGSDAFDVGGPWEFFSQSIADALAGQGSSTYSMPGLPPDDFISDWVRDSELRRGRW